MIILYACLLLVLLHVALPGSDLRRLASLRLRHTWLVWLALLTQVVVISLLPDLDGLSLAAHLSTYVLAMVFVLLNTRTAGTWLVAAGGVGNLIAIAANGGTMPADPDALRASGWSPAPGHFANSNVVAHPRVAWLGDVFHTPSWLLVHSVFSVGDVVIVVGVAVFLHQTCLRPTVQFGLDRSVTTS
jgi:lipoprotein signal peptidase